MAEPPTTIVTQAETPEAFLADRQHFWQGFNRFMVGCIILVLLILLGLWVLVY